MKFDTPATTNPIDQLKFIGQPMDRIDGPMKTSGTAPYAYERHDAVQNPAYGVVVGAAIAKAQASADEGVSNAVFALVSTVRRLGNLGGIDEEILHNPTQAAGTMPMGGSATQATQTGSGALVTSAASMYKISGF